MTAMLHKAPILAWLLTALTCFLVGALVGTGWSQAAPLPVLPTGGVVVTVEVVFDATATPSPTPRPASPRTQTPTFPWTIHTPAEPTPTPGEGGTGQVR
jgi:hypothetical protein